jgi:enoyl-CoA hydratase/carnithine racemase
VHHNADLMLNFYNSLLCIRKVPVPVIAALHGPAMGAGACLALACDMRTASPKPRILGFNFSRLGIHSGMGGSHLLERALGGSSAIINEILLTGKVLSGQEAYDMGLVNRLEDDAKGAAYELAAEVAKQNPVAVRTMLQTVRQRQDVGLEQALQREAYAQAVCYNRDDWGEGVNAVAEKRDPSFGPYHSN